VLQSSGVTVADEVKIKYDEIKKEKKHRYVIYFIKDEKQIEVEVVGKRDATYEDYLADLQGGGPLACRYGLYDFEYSHQCQGTTEVHDLLESRYIIAGITCYILILIVDNSRPQRSKSCSS